MRLFRITRTLGSRAPPVFDSKIGRGKYMGRRTLTLLLVPTNFG